MVDLGEECDDGMNNGPGLACNADCMAAFCGDGDLSPGEECDDGAYNGDRNVCKSDCTNASCGDGFVGPGEACDDGNQNDNDRCTNACALASCGDGVVSPNEECDDGNDTDTDSCTNACTQATCNDGIMNGNEIATDCGGDMCKPCSVQGLVINEIDYDLVNPDSAEFIEILNTSNAPINLVNHAVSLVNCSSNPPTVYATVNLGNAGIINPSQYLVIAPAAFNLPGGVIRVSFAGNVDQVQNGAPDAIALVDTGSMKVIDSLSYEGTCADVNIPNVGMVSLVEGMSLSAQVADFGTGTETLCRMPNGYDGNNAATDWAQSKNPTPGVANEL